MSLRKYFRSFYRWRLGSISVSHTQAVKQSNSFHTDNNLNVKRLNPEGAKTWNYYFLKAFSILRTNYKDIIFYNPTSQDEEVCTLRRENTFSSQWLYYIILSHLTLRFSRLLQKSLFNFMAGLLHITI